MRSFAIILLFSASAAIGQSPASIPKAGTVYLSIMGEPIRETDEQEPFERWFKQADENQDGSITRLELQGDADYFFATLDRNDDKVIDGDEMEHYEQVVAPAALRAVGSDLGTYARAPKAIGATPGRPNEIPIKLEGMAQSKSRIKPQAYRPIVFANVPQPVAMADANLDRRVSLQEFRGTASKRFSKYDLDHDGRLKRQELKTTKGGR